MADELQWIQIGAKRVRRDGPPLVMAEIGVNHDGSPEKGMKLVDAAAGATCEAVKFQLFRADLLLAKEAGLVEYQKGVAKSAGDLLRPLQLTKEQMGPLVKRAQGLGMLAVVTPFSVELVAECVEMGVDAIKLASPDLVNRPLVEEVCATGLPLIVSTGAAELAEVERTVGWLWKLGAGERAVILHCVSSYPTPAERATLAAITVLRARFSEMPIGYSDHTAETFTAAMAVGCGACLLEKHLTLDKKGAGPDHAASLEQAEMAEYCALARIGYAMRGPFAKQVLDVERPVREQTRQSVVTKQALAAGTVLTREMLTVKRPGTGIPAAQLDGILGRVLRLPVDANSVLYAEQVSLGMAQDEFAKRLPRVYQHLRNHQLRAITDRELFAAVFTDLIEAHTEGGADHSKQVLSAIPLALMEEFLHELEKSWDSRDFPQGTPPEVVEGRKKQWLAAQAELIPIITTFISEKKLQDSNERNQPA